MLPYSVLGLCYLQCCMPKVFATEGQNPILAIYISRARVPLGPPDTVIEPFEIHHFLFSSLPVLSLGLRSISHRYHKIWLLSGRKGQARSKL